ncbi:Crp/Fnr family transcriptional regulator [Sulfitobacter sp. D35]|uniref:Crp/Fnr family transcriptional regulator n=1 Tax=Sulfitobacter sp. D35 TaxID=3083252 RepID=UPI00296EAAB7|nr:Crp/Fnr family transcriptional regulator [Sulfitobacter sp. D35]MDW4499741.1 Crp/Fnr family transcriptional regulator [Sulfitobacter sp. D35]
MDHLSQIDWIEAVGWVASLLTIATYSMSTMLPLRILAIASSVCFVIYASVLQLWPLLAMELLLLPINLYRFWQVVALRGKLSNASGNAQADFSVVQTYGRRRKLASGAVVFERGDPVDRLYYLAEGRVRIAELGIDLSPGDIFGEIAFFTDAAARTATARCLSEAVVYSVDAKQFMRLQFEDPSFGLAVMRTITRRLTENLKGASGRSVVDMQVAAAPA